MKVLKWKCSKVRGKDQGSGMKWTAVSEWQHNQNSQKPQAL